MYKYHYYNKKRYKIPISLKTKFIIIIALIVSCGVFYFFFLSSVFRIEKLTIYGNKKVPESDIRREIDDYLNRRFLLFWKSQNILLINSKLISQKLREKFLFIDSVSAKRNYFHGLEIAIAEREIFAIYCRAKIQPNNDNGPVLNNGAAPLLSTGENNIKNCYYIDKEGVIFGEAPESTGTLLLVIREVNDNNAALGEKALNSQIINSVSDIKNSLLDKNLRVAEFLFRGEPSSDLEIFTSEGWKIYLDTHRNIYAQIDILDKALKEKISSQERETLEYIDLRIPERIYYKSR